MPGWLFCPRCSIQSSQDWTFCINCGLKLHDSERELIEVYFHRGYKYETIIDLLSRKHDIIMSMSKLKRRLAEYNLSRKNNAFNEGEVRRIIQDEAEGSGSLAGYRRMWHVLRLKHHIHIPRNVVAQILREIDPDACELRRQKKLKRRQYLSHGPNQCWHIDGCDKLKPYGFAIHSAIDGYSRKVMWLEVSRSNNDPNVTARYYLDCIKECGFCPLQTRTDIGTENGIIAAMQCCFRSQDNAPFSNENAHVYGSSTRNQRIENWWSHLKKICSAWWMVFFKDLLDSGQIDFAHDIQRECLWFCFSGILQQELQEVKMYWNTHYIRPSRHDTVGGIPDVLFQLPENDHHGAFDCSIPVSRNAIAQMETRCEPEQEQLNEYQEYFHYVMQNQGLVYPLNHREALDLFFHLVNIA